jgi:murein DD-endopeptidase MepM/ murein hydrolase activator NlpD
MTRLFTLFAVAFTALLFIFLVVQPSVAQPLLQESEPEGQPKSTPQPPVAQPSSQEPLEEDQPKSNLQDVEPEVDWTNVWMESEENSDLPHAETPIPIATAAPDGAAHVSSDADEETPLPSGVLEIASTTGEFTHVVQRGENLYRISQAYGISLEQLIAANNIQNPRRLQVGQGLIIPGQGTIIQVTIAAPQDGAALSNSNTYIVQRGDKPYEIAQRFGVSVEALMAVNQIDNPRRMNVGQVLTIPQEGDVPEVVPKPVPITPAAEPAAPVSPNIYVVQRGDNLSRIARRVGVTIQVLIEANSLANPDRINAGQTLTIPGATNNNSPESSSPPQPEVPPGSPITPQPNIPPESPTATQPEITPIMLPTLTSAEVTTDLTASGAPFIWPIPFQEGQKAKWYSSGHPGIDIILLMGTPIQAAAGGTVEFSGWNAYGFGNLVVLDHGNGYRTLYAHQSERLVATGDTVAQGDVIGLVGITGRATHPHLHFEIRQGYTPVYPCDYLPGGCQ